MILFAAIVPPLTALQAVEDAVRDSGAEPLSLRPLTDVNLPIARFGNTTLNDAERLVRELTDAADEWQAAQLSFAGGSVVDTPAERTLGVHLRGDLDRLAGLSLDVKKAAQRLRFLLDRRDFSSVLTLTSIRAGTPSGIDAAAEALAGFEGESWLVTEVSVRKQSYGHEGESEEIASIPLQTD